MVDCCRKASLHLCTAMLRSGCGRMAGGMRCGDTDLCFDANLHTCTLLDDTQGKLITSLQPLGACTWARRRRSKIDIEWRHGVHVP